MASSVIPLSTRTKLTIFAVACFFATVVLIQLSFAQKPGHSAAATVKRYESCRYSNSFSTQLSETNYTQQSHNDNKSSKLDQMSQLGDESPPLRMAGGLGATKEKDDEVAKIVERVLPELEQKTGTKYESVDVIHYKRQTVAGVNYFVKAKAKPVGGPERIVHLRIYKDLKGRTELTAYELDKKLEEELKYFQ